MAELENSIKLRAKLIYIFCLYNKYRVEPTEK